MTPRVAITRALPEAERTAERVRARGAEPVLAPLLTIVPCAYDTNVQDAQALLFTSSNGVRGFPDARGARGKIVLAVGEATAQAARDAGFADVRCADGDVAALAELARATLDPKAGKLVHIAGAQVAGDLAGRLSEAGFACERRIAYDAVAATSLPEALLGGVDVVLFHSARAAETHARLGGARAGVIAGCISAAAAAAAGVGWARLIVSPAPREAELLDAVL